MKKYSLRVLLNEAQIHQTEFLSKVFQIFQDRPDIKGKIGTFLEDQIKTTRFFDHKEKTKARKNIVFSIEKKLAQTFKGVDESQINLKLIKPLYHSIILYLTNNADVSFDNCILSSDYYMKTFYESSLDDEKELIQKGKFDFSIIFERTNFYQSFLNETIGVNRIYKVYEDEDVKIIYPANVDSFNKYIKNSKVNLSWCTQEVANWHSYTSSFYIMILLNKRVKENKKDRNYIISLKVSKDGKVNYKETCDRFNFHMTEESVKKVLSDAAELSVQEFIEEHSELVKLPDNVSECTSAIQKIYSADYISDSIKETSLKDLTTNLIISSTTYEKVSLEEIESFIF